MTKSMAALLVAASAFASTAQAILFEFRSAWSAGGTAVLDGLANGLSPTPAYTGSVTVTFGPGEHCMAAGFDYDINGSGGDQVTILPGLSALGVGQSFAVDTYIDGGVANYVANAVTDCRELQNTIAGDDIADRVVILSQHVTVPAGETGTATIRSSTEAPPAGTFGAVFRQIDVASGLPSSVYIWAETTFGSPAPGHVSTCGTTQAACGATSASAHGDGNCATISFGQ